MNSTWSVLSTKQCISYSSWNICSHSYYTNVHIESLVWNCLYFYSDFFLKRKPFQARKEVHAKVPQSLAKTTLLCLSTICVFYHTQHIIAQFYQSFIAVPLPPNVWGQGTISMEGSFSMDQGGLGLHALPGYRMYTDGASVTCVAQLLADHYQSVDWGLETPALLLCLGQQKKKLKEEDGGKTTLVLTNSSKIKIHTSANKKNCRKFNVSVKLLKFNFTVWKSHGAREEALLLIFWAFLAATKEEAYCSTLLPSSYLASFCRGVQ